MDRMNLSRLLIPSRLGCPEAYTASTAGRTEFQRDFDRVLFSSAFRRLQSKTQVFPFPETAMIHTRLTHSLETSSVGRSLGTIAAEKLNNGRCRPKVDPRNIGAIVSAACLAHDIGNPPFGHSGEKAIAEFFEGEHGQAFLTEMTDEQRQDFVQFDGNAMGFRLLTHSNPKLTSVSGGLGLTYPTLAAFVKYPCSASNVQREGLHVSRKKAGLFSSSVEVYSQIAQMLELPTGGCSEAWARHPLSFLTEAADDICYTITDLEDGHRHGLVEYDEVKSHLLNIALVHMTETDLKNMERICDDRNKIGYLRAKAINSLICQVADAFDENAEQIISGEYDLQLTDQVASSQALKDIQKLSRDRIYSHRTILQIEAAGFQVVPGLLNMFLSALKWPARPSSKKVRSLIPDEYVPDPEESPHETVMSITAYVAGMTDTFAVELYRNLMGFHLPKY